MKYLIKFNESSGKSFKDVYLKYPELTKICKEYGITNYTINNSYNKLITLDGCPNEIGGDFNCGYNKLITLDGCPNEIGGILYCEGNPIWDIYYLFDDHKEYQDSLDYNYLRGTNIVKSRFKEALEEIGLELPDKIPGYNYI